MAKKKRSKKKKGTHRRHVSGIGDGIMDGVKLIAGVTGGILAGRYANAQFLSNMDAKLVGGAEFVAGAFGAAKLKKSTGWQPIVRAVSIGVAANGIHFALGAKGLAVLPASVGYGPDLATGYSPNGLAGYRNVPKVGFPKPANIGFPKPGNIGMVDRERARTARMYAGVYN